MLQCDKCGYDNELGRIFCHSCGTRLDLSKVKPPTEAEKMRRKIKQGASRTVRIVIDLVLVGAVALLILLICMAPEVKPVEPTDAEVQLIEKKRQLLETFSLSRKPGTMAITEAELNAYLNKFEDKKPEGQGIEVTPVLLRITLKQDAAKIEFIGMIHFFGWFDKKIYFGYDGVPKLEKDKFVFTPTGGQIGKLPVHVRILTMTGLFDKYFGSVFGKLDNEKKLLERMAELKVEPGTLTLVKGAAAAR